MKTKIFNKELKINSIPMETVFLDSNGKQDSFILLDDIKENRWKISFKVHLALKMTGLDYSGLNFFKGSDFPNDCFENIEGYPVPQFQAYIFEVEKSNWIADVKKESKRS